MREIKGILPTVNIDFSSIDISQPCDMDEMQNHLAKHYGVSEKCVDLFHGEESLIDALLQYFYLIKRFQGKCYIYAPCTKEFELKVRKYTNRLELINRFDTQPSVFIENSIVIFTNPSTPDGKYHDIEALLNLWKTYNLTVIIDESFFEFYEGISATKFIESYEKLYVVKSMASFYHMQGVRLATLISSEENIKSVKSYESHKTLSAFDMAYVKAVLEDKNFKRISQAIHAKNIILLEEVLRCSGLFEVIHTTNTNFMLAKLKKMKAKKLKELLSKERISIKEFSHMQFLGNKYVGFEVHSEDCIKSLIQAFQKVLG